MKKSALFLAMSLALGLSACGGGGGGDTASPSPAPAPSPSPTDVCTNLDGVQTTVPPGYFAQGTTCTMTDACVNYEGLQTELEIAQKNFVRDAKTGTCKIALNHTSLAASGFDVARMKGYIGKDVVIHVSDSGFYPIHQEFTGRIEGSVNFSYSNGVTTPIEGVWETPGSLGLAHGTRVSSVALGAKVGAAPGARLFAAFGVTDVGYLIKRGARIINESTTLMVDNMLYQSADEFAGNKNHFLVVMRDSKAVFLAGAGNKNNDFSAIRDRSFPNNTSLMEHPDEAENYLMVGAYEVTTQSLANYSGFPGYFKPFQDRFLVTGSGGYDVATADAPDSYYIGGSGTSYSTPMASGALAILLEVNPRLTAVQAAQILLDTADRPARLGYGTTCSQTTSKGTFTSDCGAMKYGRGVMNVMAAIEKAKMM